MNTKYIPAIVMLLGGLVRGVVALYDKELFTLQFALSLLLVLFIFYIIGLIVKAIIDKYIPIVEEEEIQDGEETLEEETELEDFTQSDETDSTDTPEE